MLSGDSSQEASVTAPKEEETAHTFTNMYIQTHTCMSMYTYRYMLGIHVSVSVST